jgi:hypothetical protein
MYREQEKEYKRDVVCYILKRYGSLNFIHMLMLGQQDEQMAVPITYTFAHQNCI